MWFGTRCLLRGLWCAWRLALECERAERAAQALEEARSKLGKLSSSIWLMRKEELVRLAMEELGWTHGKAMKTTTGQLRLALREHRAALRGPAGSLPTGLSRMKLDELQVEATQRSILLQTPEGRRKTREMLIRDIREHEDKANAKSSSLGATPKASARRRSASGKRGNPDDVEWMSVDHREETGSSGFSSASTAGPAAMARAQELLGKMPPEDLQRVLAGLAEGRQV